LFWIKGQLLKGNTPADLRKLSIIDPRWFIVGDSDVDIISRQKVSLDAAHYGITKIDSRGPDLFDPETEEGRNERLQGYIPVEKIRLSRLGIVPTSEFGDGVAEILTGQLTISFSSDEDFRKTH
jgi:hypothetical protein